MPKTLSANKLIVTTVILITVVFLLPLFVGGFSGNSISKLFTNNSNGFVTSLQRTISFSLISAFINVVGGFSLALLFSKIPLNSNLGRKLSFFILPITLGNVAVVFVFKMLLFNTSFFNMIVQRGSATQTIFILFIQFWQFGLLFAYLFWLNIQNIPKRIEYYANVAGLSQFEKVRDILLPHSRNLFILLLFIGFTFSFYEDAKSQFIFKASQGTETELINHWLERTYQSTLLINADHANKSIFQTGVIVFAIVVILFLVLGFLIFLLFRVFSKFQISGSKNAYAKKNKISVVVAIVSIAIIFTPVIFALLKSQYHFSEDLYSVFFPFALTLIAACAATIFAIAFGISSRLAFTKLLSGFNSKSLLYFLTIFLLQLLPPLCIVLCGFKWLSWIGYGSELLIYIVWIAGHCILTLPILGSFVLATHFSVKENELNYLIAHKISVSSIVQYSFLKKFRVEYIFTLLFAFNFIWNDAGLNMILSDRIPSFVANLQMLFIGRAADYSKATGFVLVAVTLSLICIFIWQSIISKNLKKLNEFVEI